MSGGQFSGSTSHLGPSHHNFADSSTWPPLLTRLYISAYQVLTSLLFLSHRFGDSRKIRVTVCHPGLLCLWFGGWSVNSRRVAVLWPRPPPRARARAFLETLSNDCRPLAVSKCCIQCSCTTEGRHDHWVGMLGRAPGRWTASARCCPLPPDPQSLQWWCAVGWARICWDRVWCQCPLAPLRPFSWPTLGRQFSFCSLTDGRTSSGPALGSVVRQLRDHLSWHLRSPWWWREQQRRRISGKDLTNFQSIWIVTVCHYM